MTDEKRTCWICGELGYGETYLGNTHICFVCRDSIKRQRVDVAGKQLAGGMAAMSRDQNNPRTGLPNREPAR